MLFVIIVLHSEFLRPQAEGCQPSGRCHGGEMMRTRPVKKAWNTQSFTVFAFIVFLAIAGNVFDLSSKPQKYGTPKKTQRCRNHCPTGS